MTLNKILIIAGISLVVLLGIYYIYYKINSLNTELINVKEQNSLLNEKSSENKDLYLSLLSKIEKRDEQYNNYIKLVDQVNKKHVQIIAKYNRETKQEQLTKVLDAKPQLVEKILNERINELFRCIEKATNNPNINIPCHFE